MKKKTEWIWLEEYDCGCSFTARTRRELLGYCEVHGSSRSRVHRIPKPKDFKDSDYGYAG